MKKTPPLFPLLSFALPEKKIFGRFAALSIPSFLVTALIFFSFNHANYLVEFQEIKTREENKVAFETYYIPREFSAIISDLQYVSNSAVFKNYLLTKDEEEKTLFLDALQTLLITHNIYDNIIFLNKEKKEAIRIDNEFGTPIIATPENTQSREENSDFEKTMSLDCQGVFISPLELASKQGKVSQPRKPILRFSLAACDEQGEKKGILAYTYLADHLLEKIEQILHAYEDGSETMLLNKDGYWFLSPHAEETWGFMYGKEWRFQKRFPQEWELMQQKKSGQILTKNGFFTFRFIFPMANILPLNEDFLSVISNNFGCFYSREYYWLLVQHIPHEYLDKKRWHFVRNAIWQLLAVSMIMLPLTWIYCREKIRSEAASREALRSKEFITAVTSQLEEGVIVVNMDEEIVMVNSKVHPLLGWGDTYLLGKNIETIFPQQNEKKVFHGLIGRRGSCHYEPYTIITANGQELFLSLTVSSLFLDDKQVGCVLTFQDIGERLQCERRLQEIAIHDPLTGVKNRGELERVIIAELNRAVRYEGTCSILLADLDHFKQVNDTYGHPAGDKILKHVCNIINRELRESDTIGRYGGEEFVIVLPQTSLKEAQCFAERILEAVRSTPYIEDELHISVTMSLGLACYPENGTSFEKLISEVDKALYKAKKTGRNRLVCATN